MSVRDYTKFGSEPIGLGSIYTNGQNTPPTKVFWSKDGTLVVVKEDAWFLFYDYQTHRSGGGNWEDAAKFLQKRGGEGVKFITDENRFDDVARHVWWWESYPGHKDERLRYPSPNLSR